MKLSRRRVWAMLRKELRDMRRNGNVVYAMVILPVVFLIQPVIQIFTLRVGATPTLHREQSLVYLLAVPALTPAAMAAYSIVGKRVQGTLEPLLSTPIQKGELILGKALAVFLPSVGVSYVVFALFIAVVELFAAPGVAGALVRAPYVVAQLVFTPLLCGWSIWLGMAVSARSKDLRAAGQVSLLVSLPSVAITSLVAFDVIPASLRLALGFGIGLLVLNRIGWYAASAALDRERLITNTR
ncbi:MAG: ABC transporter permease subunit [Actinomycetota bacterium]|nr:ABC transporter permease subunit [Actinomycetota bacterium]